MRRPRLTHERRSSLRGCARGSSRHDLAAQAKKVAAASGGQSCLVLEFSYAAAVMSELKGNKRAARSAVAAAAASKWESRCVMFSVVRRTNRTFGLPRFGLTWPANAPAKPRFKQPKTLLVYSHPCAKACHDGAKLRQQAAGRRTNTTKIGRPPLARPRETDAT